MLRITSNDNGNVICYKNNIEVKLVCDLTLVNDNIVMTSNGIMGRLILLDGKVSMVIDGQGSSPVEL